VSPAHRRAAQPALCWGSACARRVRKEAQRSTVQALLQALELKDPYTRGHSERVGELSALIATELGATAPRVAAVRLGGTLHDIGKLGVPTRVLRKNGPLTAEERHVVQRHPADGDDVLRGISVLDEARAAVLHHHERLDGTGYPYGLGGGRIPEAARIVAVADAFDAMTSTRSYRSARPARTALAELRRCAGTQFDPVMVEALGRALAAGGWRPVEPVIRSAVPGELSEGEVRDEFSEGLPDEVLDGPREGVPDPEPAGAPASARPPALVPPNGATAAVQGVLLASAATPSAVSPSAVSGTATGTGHPVEPLPDHASAGPDATAPGAAPPPASPLTWAWLDSGAKGKEVG